MVTSYELADDQEYYDILEDVKLECQPFGEVIRVVIPRVKEGFPPSSEGNIFVEFSHPDMARRAASSLIGRKFADRTVTVEYVNNL
jgi:splicing factor U2AF subunit